MPDTEQKQHPIKLHHVIMVGCTLLGMVGGAAINAITIAKNIASVEYVDTKSRTVSENLTKYTDDQVGRVRTEFTQANQAMLDNFNNKFKDLIDLNKTTLDKAIDHSDYNKKSMEVEYAGVSTGVAALKDSFQDFKREIEDLMRAQRHR